MNAPTPPVQPQNNQKPRSSSMKTWLIVAIVLVVSPIVVGGVLVLAGMTYYNVSCESKAQKGRDLIKQKMEIVRNANGITASTKGQPTTGRVCNEATQEYHVTASYSAQDQSVGNIQRTLEELLGVSVEDEINDKQFRANPDGEGACHLITLSNPASDSHVKYLLSFNYEGATDDTCSYWPNTEPEYGQQDSDVVDTLEYTITYVYS